MEECDRRKTVKVKMASSPHRLLGRGVTSTAFDRLNSGAGCSRGGEFLLLGGEAAAIPCARLRQRRHWGGGGCRLVF
ncbi:hypothetical protein G6O67_002131 [Ophiocordyceps sinensis]|uniref:Uncharacterized protein n=1 Tax=Ophiocordyceps sinensis TaxID=72228 RepID=A0A8H4PTM4_9HYPO|nr:hypothetical protein G6O67_002131 [Ophiocordyceps sinensis]